MATSRSNKVTIKCDTITAITYIGNSLVITSGQPSSPPPTISQSSDEWSITMDCGRKANSSVAGQFTNLCGGIGHITCPSAWSDTSPSDLNFFFGNSVKFTINSVDYRTNIYFGQGHSHARNNWWIGGPNIAYSSNNALLVFFSPTTNEVVQVYTISGGVSNFTLTAWF